jgi:hypothetical protein
VDAIGFADLMPGSGHGPGGWVDVAQFEVYARPVPRSGGTQPAPPKPTTIAERALDKRRTSLQTTT